MGAAPFAARSVAFPARKLAIAVGKVANAIDLVPFAIVWRDWAQMPGEILGKGNLIREGLQN